MSHLHPRISFAIYHSSFADSISFLKAFPRPLLRGWQNKLPPKEFPRGSPLRHYNSRDRRRFYRAALNQNVQPFSPYVPRGGDQVAVERPRVSGQFLRTLVLDNRQRERERGRRHRVNDRWVFYSLSAITQPVQVFQLRLAIQFGSAMNHLQKSFFNRELSGWSKLHGTTNDQFSRRAFWSVAFIANLITGRKGDEIMQDSKIQTFVRE